MGKFPKKRGFCFLGGFMAKGMLLPLQSHILALIVTSLLFCTVTCMKSTITQWHACVDKKFLETKGHVDMGSTQWGAICPLSLFHSDSGMFLLHKVSHYWNYSFVHSCREFVPSECQALNLAADSAWKVTTISGTGSYTQHPSSHLQMLRNNRSVEPTGQRSK